MTRCSALALALAVAGVSVTGFVAPISRAVAPSCTRSGGKSCNVRTQREALTGSGDGEESRGKSLGAIEGILDILGGFGPIPTLPQNDVDIRAREEQILQSQALYRWTAENIPVGVPYLDGNPPIEQDAKSTWIIQVAGVAAKTLLGVLRSGYVGVADIVLALTDPDEMNLIASKIYETIQEATANVRPEAFEDYNELHHAPVKTPDAEYDYSKDETFARMRLQGPNCVTIKKCTQAIRNKLTILDTDPDYTELKEHVDSLIVDGKLFAVDQEMIKDQTADPLEGLVERYVTCGIALFEVTDDELLPIKPIGIQLSQGAEPTPIFTPSDDENLWLIAKTCFEAAEFTIHEVVSHLGCTHLVLEGALVGIYRNFAREHPIHVLLQPHLEGTALINRAAQTSLINEGGGVDKLLGNTIDDCWNLANVQVLNRLAFDFSPEADFESRSMTTDDFPGRYMYRDFGLKYWEATHTWVTEYLSIYYKSDTDIDEDSELTAFLGEMVDFGKVLWLDEFSTSNDKLAFLAKVLASYIYSASTLHAAVNFPQQPIMSYNPATPGAIYQPPPTDKEAKTYQQYLDYLPPMQIASLQVVLTTLLGSVHHTKLGEYDYYQFSDPLVQDPLAKFQDAMQQIEIDLEYENSMLVNAAIERGDDKYVAMNFAYKTLLPDNIPQSINI